MPFLVMVFLTLACLPEVHNENNPAAPPRTDPNRIVWPDPTWNGSSVPLTALFSVLVMAAPVGFAFVLSRRVRLTLAYDPGRRDAVLRRYERARTWHQIGLFVSYAVTLCICGWGWLVGQVWDRGDGVAWPGAELLILAPFLTALFASWLCFFDAERAFHSSSRAVRLSDTLAETLLVEDDSSHALPPLLTTRWAYLGYQFRHRLALVFIPLGLLLLQKEASRQFPSVWEEWYLGATLGGMCSLLALLIGMPWVLRLVLGLRPLPAGPLRDRLLASARRLRFRCSDLLLWNTGHAMANAMVVGLLPWPRYVVFTDRLLEEFSPEEVEAVLGHEIGHVRHLHMPLYLGFLSASMAVFGILLAGLWPQLLSWTGAETAVAASGAEGFWTWRHHPYLKVLPAVAGLLAYIFVVFGFLSRRCERQADVFGCRAGSCTDPNCQGHDEKTILAGGGYGLCPTGIRTFIRALDKVAALNGISRERPGYLQSWQHSTIARRVGFLEGLLADPRREPSFQRWLLVMKCGMVAVLMAALAFAVGLGG